MVIGNREFEIGNRCYIMGILNVTPDSFSDGGLWQDIDKALCHTENMINDGADIIDVGGESTRPGHEAITVSEELDRVIPAIEAITKRFDLPVSVDTSKSTVAEAALSAGAVMVNDVWGLKRDPEMANVIARNNAACCLMHNREEINYNNFLEDMLRDLSQSVKIALDAGIEPERIILDPGIGFKKTVEMNLEAINRLDLVAQLGYPVLLGASRKSFIGKILDLPSTERIEGTLVATVIAIMRGCSFVRVHDVKEAKRTIIMTEAILYARK